MILSGAVTLGTEWVYSLEMQISTAQTRKRSRFGHFTVLVPVPQCEVGTRFPHVRATVPLSAIVAQGVDELPIPPSHHVPQRIINDLRKRLSQSGTAFLNFCVENRIGGRAVMSSMKPPAVTIRYEKPDTRMIVASNVCSDTNVSVQLCRSRLCFGHIGSLDEKPEDYRHLSEIERHHELGNNVSILRQDD